MFNLSQLILLVIVTISVSFSQTSFAAVGKVAEQTGPTEIIRNKKTLDSKINTAVEMNDVIITAKAKAKLAFEDKTTVNITEQSKLVIDDFVYDPNKGSGKLAMKVVMGTARYTSGQIAKSNPQSVNIQTPTATVAVRGTDFSMTVDELGRSLIILLPSCDKKSCVTGAIEVITEAGSVYMDVAFQATYVASRDTPPAKPYLLTIDMNNINNLLIVSPPKAEEDEKFKSDTKTALDINFLDKDLLKFNALEEDNLKFNALDLNRLDADLLLNALDQSNQALAASQETILSEKTMLPGYNAASGLKYGITEEDKLVIYRVGNFIAQVTLDKESDASLNINQEGTATYQQINRGGSTSINIIQK